MTLEPLTGAEMVRMGLIAGWMLGIPHFTKEFINALVEAKVDGTEKAIKTFSLFLGIIWPIMIGWSIITAVRTALKGRA